MPEDHLGAGVRLVDVHPVQTAAEGRVPRPELVPVSRPSTDLVIERDDPACARTVSLPSVYPFLRAEAGLLGGGRDSHALDELLAFGQVFPHDPGLVPVRIIEARCPTLLLVMLKAAAVECKVGLPARDVLHGHLLLQHLPLVRNRTPPRPASVSHGPRIVA